MFDDERGINTVLGFMFVFGIIILSMSVWQAQVVPMKNQQTEFDHYTQARNDMSNLKSEYIDAAESGSVRSESIKLGTRFSGRVLFVNSPPAAGRLHTESPSTITSNSFNPSNVCGLDSPPETRTLTLDTQYNHLTDSEALPYKFENTVLYRQAPDGTAVIESDQSLVEGSEINLYPLTESISHSGVESTTVEFRSAEMGEKELTGSLSLRIPTDLSAETWRELLSDEPNVNKVSEDGQKVKIELADASWTVRCAAVGVEKTPDVGDLPEADSDGNNITVGVGGVSEYGENFSSDTFSNADGRWEGVTCTDQLLLSDGEPASKPNADNLQGDVIRVSGSLEDTTGESYTIDIKLARAADSSWNTKKVIIYDGNDNNANAELLSSSAMDIYNSSETDILDLSNYDDPDTGSGSFSDYVNRISSLEDRKPVVWQTSRITGRVTMELECDPLPAPPASGIQTVDGTTPNAESSAVKFGIQVAEDETKTVRNVTITRPGNRNSDVKDPTGLQAKNKQNNEVVLTAPSGSNNETGSLDRNIRLDGTTYGLDQEATFSDGAVLNIDIRELNNGNVKWTYKLVDNRNDADVVVTFGLEEGTQFEAYLRVTNVNS